MTSLGYFYVFPMDIVIECIEYLRYDYCALREVNKTWRELCDSTNGIPSPYVRLKHTVWQNRILNIYHIKIATNQPLESILGDLPRGFVKFISPDNLVSSRYLFQQVMETQPYMLEYVNVDALRLLLQQDVDYNIPVVCCTDRYDPEFYDIIVKYMKRRNLTLDVTFVRDVKFIRSMIAHNYCKNINAIELVTVDSDRVDLRNGRRYTSYFTIQELVNLPDFTLTASNLRPLGYREVNTIETYCQLKYGTNLADQPTFCGISTDWIKQNVCVFNIDNLIKFKNMGVINRRDCECLNYSRYIAIWDTPSQPVTVEELIENEIINIPDEVIMREPAALFSKHERLQREIRLKTHNQYEHVRRVFNDACNDH
jgi:hypothetical protein